MLIQRRFNIVKVSKYNGYGIDTAKEYDKEVNYDGKNIIINLDY